MPTRSRNAHAGFSLAELLVASTLLTIGLLAAAQLFASSTATNSNARAVTYATVLAAEKMEQLRARPFDDAAFAHSPPGALITDVDGWFDHPADGYTRRWSVEPLPSYPDDGVVIRVMVTRAGAAASAVAETIKVRKPTGASPPAPPG